MANEIRINKGLDISLIGEANKKIVQPEQTKLYGIKPTDFPYLTPKLSVKEGDEVKAGSPLFFDKYKPEVLFTAPISGKVFSINRGERRRILEVVIESDGKNEYEAFKKGSPENLSSDDIKSNLLVSGCWPLLVQRPYSIIANPKDTPRDIYISCFNSAPLAPDYEFIIGQEFNSFQSGINALSKLCGEKIKLGVNSKSHKSIFENTKNAEIVKFSGPHPAGNVGVQINKTVPINKGEVIWTVNALDVLIIGRLFEHGKFDARKIIALTGSEVVEPQYYNILLGTPISKIINKNVKKDLDTRIISGNILTGEKLEVNEYFNYYDYQITVIPEGNKPEILGWAMPGLKKFSLSRTYTTWLSPNKKRIIDTNMRGGERPFIVSGNFEKVFPMDIYPVQLLKAIIVKDIDLMEELGIYEVAEEDFALCEVISISKIEVQKIIREGIEMMIKEFN